MLIITVGIILNYCRSNNSIVIMIRIRIMIMVIILVIIMIILLSNIYTYDMYDIPMLRRRIAH